jgi:6-phosphogluconolactonase
VDDYILKITADIEALSQWAAQKIAASCRQAVEQRGRFLFVLNGGGTPRRLFELLGADFRNEIDWDKTHIFWGDERCVPPDDKESNYGQACEIIFNRIEIPESNIHRIKGELEPAEASRDYSLVLKRFASPPLEWPRFDLVLLGMGEDGHTASLFPGSPVDSTEPVIAVSGHYQGRPANRITLTPPVLNSARTILFMVAGEDKAEILNRVLNGERNPKLLPVQRIDPKDGEMIWLADKAAAGKLSKKET